MLAKMLASTTVVVAILLLQDTILKPLFAWPSEYLSASQMELPNDEENYFAPLSITDRECEMACQKNTADDYFNRSYFHLNNSVSYDIGSSETTCNDCAASCGRHQLPLREYKMGDVVRCLDSLSVKRNRRPMHIAFIGDSTVRQHFVSFIRVNTCVFFLAFRLSVSN
jgi:hypothetical protein